MLAKIGLTILGILLTGVLLNVYLVLTTIFTITLLGIESDAAFNVQYAVCLLAGAVSSFFLLRRAWPKAKAAAPPSSDETAASHE